MAKNKKIMFKVNKLLVFYISGWKMILLISTEYNIEHDDPLKQKLIQNYQHLLQDPITRPDL